MVALPSRRSLWVKTDEIQARTNFPAYKVRLVRAMVKKFAQKFRSLWIRSSGAVRAPDAGFRKRPQNGVNSKIVKLEVFFGRPFPIVDVGFVPHFPQPGFHFSVAIALPKVANESKHQFCPLLIILWRICPSRVNRSLRKTVTIGLGMCRECFRHESNFHQRLDFLSVKGVEDAVNNGPAVNGIPVCVFRISVGGSPLQ